jgi:hypothetical protein
VELTAGVARIEPMAKLFGAQKMVLQPISKIEEETGESVQDTQIAERTNIALNNVRDWLLPSEVQANAISQHIDVVIGMRTAIGDEAAIQFAVEFYDAVGAGEDFEPVVQLGRRKAHE